MKAIVFSIILGLLVPNASFAQDANTSAPGVTDSNRKMAHVMCKNGSTVRTLRIVQKDSSCRTVYTKNGVEEVVGKSKTDDICISVFEKILVNLEKGNWKCKDVSSSRISSAE